MAPSPRPWIAKQCGRTVTQGVMAVRPFSAINPRCRQPCVTYFTDFAGLRLGRDCRKGITSTPQTKRGRMLLVGHSFPKGTARSGALVDTQLPGLFLQLLRRVTIRDVLR